MLIPTSVILITAATTSPEIQHTYVFLMPSMMLIPLYNENTHILRLHTSAYTYLLFDPSTAYRVKRKEALVLRLDGV